MSGKKKLFAGDGWSFEPAGAGKTEDDVVSLPPSGQKPKIGLEKRPKGKTVTIVAGLVLSGADRKLLARELKNACGSGGTDKEDWIEIQGDHREAVRRFLVSRGWRIG